MGSLQLQENIESLIKSIILKHPKIENDILYLREVFIDSVKGLNKDFWKMVKKYEKMKQKLRNQQQSSNNISNGSYELSSTKSARQKRSSKQQQGQSTKYSDYDINLMTMILQEAKSIKCIFEQTLKVTSSEQHQPYSIKTTSIINIYNSYKDFYKSFKQKHKQYMQNNSYDQRHIHKNSTQMKQRLIDELKRQIQKRKQLQQKLSSLQTSIEKTLKHKHHQIQKLKRQLQQFQLSNHNSHHSKNKLINISTSQQNQIKNQNSKIQYHQTNKQQNKSYNQNPQQLSDSQSSQSQIHNSEQNESNTLQNDQNSSKFQSDSQKYDQKKQQVSKQPNKSNFGKFYMGQDIIRTGRINNCQIRKINKQSDQKGHSDNLRVQSREIKQIEHKRSKNHKMTFGNQEQVDKEIFIRQGDIKSGQRMKEQKIIQKQMNRLKEQLQKQRQQKQSLRQKIKQSDIQYRRLERQVDQLYKLMSQKQQPNYSKQQCELISKEDQGQLVISKKDQGQIRAADSPGKWKVNHDNITKKRTLYQNKLLRHQNKQTESYYDDCDDFQDIIKKAEKSLIINNSQNLINTTSPAQINHNQLTFADLVSPSSKKNSAFHPSNQQNIKKLASPTKNIPLLKTNSLQQYNKTTQQSVHTPTKNIKSNQNCQKNQLKNSMNSKKAIQKQIELNQRSNIEEIHRDQMIQQSRIQKPSMNKEISSLSIRSYSNNKLSPYKNLPPMSSRNRVQNQMRAQLQQIQQYYAQRIKQKEQEALMFQDQVQKQINKSNVLMMMLLTQAGTLQQFILKQQLSQQYTVFEQN